MTEDLRYLSSAQVLPEWINRNPAANAFASNGDNPLNFVSHSRGSVHPVLSPLHGLIVDSQNRPVWGATITDFDAHETRSGNDGRFGFCSIDSGREYGLTVTHPDYETQKVPLAAGAGRYSDGKLKIVLQRRKDR